MTTRGVVDALNKESVQAIARLIQLIGFPALTIIGTMVYNQASIIIENQNAMIATQAEHGRQLSSDSITINKLVRVDQLFMVKQNATKDALQNNSVIGTEFLIDYNSRYSELFQENRFINP